MHWRNKLIGVLVLIMLFGLGLRQEHGTAQTEPTDEPAFAPDRILVKTDESAPAGAIESISRQNDARVEDKLPHSRVSVIDLPQDLSVREAVRRYESSPNVEYAEPDYKIQPAKRPDAQRPAFPENVRPVQQRTIRRHLRCRRRRAGGMESHDWGCRHRRGHHRHRDEHKPQGSQG